MTNTPRIFKYFNGVSFRKSHIHIATTGAAIKIDQAFLRGVCAVSLIYASFLARSVKHVFGDVAHKGTIAFYPQTPGPWYNIWQVIRLAGLKTVSDITIADYIFVFEDKTYSVYDKGFAQGARATLINGQVDDISKEHVADKFEAVFGYSLRIDPLTYHGLAVQKSNLNGTHDGIVISCPITADRVSDDDVYQRLVDSTFDGKTSEDLRVAFVLGELALVYHKHKPLTDRFGTHYLSVDVKMATDVFSEEEVKLITEFCKQMGLDFGAIDVMRDKLDGQIYIVDVNKTCMPVLSLTLKTQIKSQQIIADAFGRGLARLV